MVASTSRLAYLDCIELMDQALENTKGVKISFGEKGYALHYRTRLHTARTICRNDNRQAYPENHTLHGRSIYDGLVVREPREEGGLWWVYIEKIVLNSANIVPLGEPEVMRQVAHIDPPKLEAPIEQVEDDKITIFDPPKQARRV